MTNSEGSHPIPDRRFRVLIIVLQCLLGIAIGAFCAWLMDEHGPSSELGRGIMLVLASFYVGLFLGVVIPGVIYLQRIGLSHRVLRSILSACLGLTICLLAYLLLMRFAGASLQKLFIINIIAVALPLAGAISGFHFRIRQTLGPKPDN